MTTTKKAASAAKAEDQKIAKQQKLADEHPEAHPALEDAPKAEVAKRSQDQTSTAAESFTKDYVVLKSTFEGTVDKDPLHVANIEAARNFLITQGLRPTGDGKFVGSTEHPDGVSLILTYTVPATPAVTATEQTVAHAHVTLDDQHAAEASQS